MQSVIKLSKKLSQLKRQRLGDRKGKGRRRARHGKQSCCVCDKQKKESEGNGLPHKGNGKMIVILRIRTVIPKYFDSVTRDALGL